VSLKFRHLEAAMRLRSPCAMMVRMAERRRKRPRDPLALAKMIGDIATGQTSILSRIRGIKLPWNWGD
jgi:hypothetical protein